MKETCLQIALRKGKPEDADEIRDAFEQEAKIRQRFIDAGKSENLDQKVALAVLRQVSNRKIKAALKRKAAAQNIIAREKLVMQIQSLISDGLVPHKAIRAVVVGAHRFAKTSRVSWARQVMSHEARFITDMEAEIQRDKPHIFGLVNNPEFDKQLRIELYERREGGTPGKTGNSDAEYLAGKLSAYMELARTDANRFGAMIGRIWGYAGPQIHDDHAMMRAGKTAWVKFIKDLLDWDRSFPDAANEAEIEDILGKGYDTIITGVSSKPSAALLGQRTGPANLAEQMGQHRVYHFKNAEADALYRERFSKGTTFGDIIQHQRKMARSVASLEIFGPNPTVMIHSILARLQQNLRKQLSGEPVKPKKVGGIIPIPLSVLPPGDLRINKLIDKLEPKNMEGITDLVTHMSATPVNPTLATIGSNIRTSISLAKLGGILLSAFPDLGVNASASFRRGAGYWNGVFDQLEAIRLRMSSNEWRAFQTSLGEGADAINGFLANPALAEDGPVGWLANRAQQFYRWTGITGWTDALRGGSAQTISGHLGANRNLSFDKLDVRHQEVLTFNGITPVKWEVMRQATAKLSNGKFYMTPDLIRHLDDDQIKIAVPGIDGMKPDRAAKALADARYELEMDLRGYIADETTNSIVETDPAAQLIMTWGGHRRGTPAGEGIRFLMHVKGYPTAFAQRVLGRAIMANPGANMAERLMNNKAHIGGLIAGTMVLGYLSLTSKDIMRGYWPPRDPFSPETMLAALAQGGGLGIYGDFLFGNMSRFGQSPLVTAAGPSVGVLADLYDLWTDVKAGDAKAAQALRLTLDNTPFINLFYLRPALDILILNSFREWASPGYLARQERQRRKDYGQERYLPRTLEEAMR